MEFFDSLMKNDKQFSKMERINYISEDNFAIYQYALPLPMLSIREGISEVKLFNNCP